MPRKTYPNHLANMLAMRPCFYNLEMKFKMFVLPKYLTTFRFFMINETVLQDLPALTVFSYNQLIPQTFAN